jgi:hypothetical protein
MAANQIPLNQDTYEKIKEYSSKAKRSVIDLAVFSYDMRMQYLEADGRKYSSAFMKWWKEHKLENQFGSLPTWTKYAKVGELLQQTRARTDKSFERLPYALEALYQISQLTDDEFRLCLQNTYMRTSLTQSESEWKRPKTPKPLIHPHVTAKAIEAWRRNWREPKVPSKKDARSLVLARVMIHQDFLKVNAQSEPDGPISQTDVREFSRRIAELFSGKDSLVRVDLNAEALCDRLEKRVSSAKVKRTRTLKKTSRKPRVK